MTALGNLSAVPVILGVPFEAVYELSEIQLRQLDRMPYLNVTSILHREDAWSVLPRDAGTQERRGSFPGHGS